MWSHAWKSKAPKMSVARDGTPPPECTRELLGVASRCEATPAGWIRAGWCGLAVGLVAWAGASSAVAQDPPMPPDIKQVIEPGASALTAPRRLPGLLVDVSEFPGNATVVTAEQIAASSASSLPELLGRYEGVSVMDFSGFGLGADGSVNLRGVVNSSRSGALVLVDGVRQNRFTGDEAHWQSLPLEQIERIEILRGGSSVIYGEGALSGLISITLKHRADRPLETEEGFEVGTFGQYHEFASARGRTGPVNYSTGYDRHDVRGYRESTKARTTTIHEHVGVDLLPTLHVETGILHEADTTFSAGGITPEQSEARRRQHGAFLGFFDDETTQVSLDAVWRGPAGLSLTSAAFQRSRESDSIFGSRYAIMTPSQGLSLRSSHEQDLGTVHHAMISGIELLQEKASTGYRESGRYSESTKGSYGFYVEETLRVFDRASLVGGFRYDRARFQEDISYPAFVGVLLFHGLSPKVGLSVDVLKPLTLYASYSRPFKAPNVDDFSAAVATGFFGNVSLQPQQGDAYELGFRTTGTPLGSLKGAWFYTLIDDEILVNAVTGGFQSQNFDTIRSGVEISATPALPIPRLTSTLTYTFTDAKFRKGSFDGKTLPATPHHRFTATAQYEVAPHLFLTADWLLVQSFFRINDFGNALPGHDYGVLNVGVRYALKHATAYLKIANVTNAEYTSFQSSDGALITTGENPAPPITFLGGVTYRF